MQSVTSNAVANALSYSTSEVFTGKYWIDGKKIYRRTFVFLNQNISSTPTLLQTIPEVAVSNITKRESVFINTVIKVVAGEMQACAYLVYGTDIYAYQTLTSQVTGWNISYTIEYTKTAD